MGLLVLCVSAVNGLRLLRLFPNNDPIMAGTMPMSARGRRIVAFLFPVLCMVSFDVLSGKVGLWTGVTALTYGAIGLGLTGAYGRMQATGHRIGVVTYVWSGAVAVLVYDFITGPIMSSLLWSMPFSTALAGQVPFTIKHLASVAVYSVTVAPAIDLALRRVPLARSILRASET